MEPDRVEMSVGSGTVNGDHLANGVAANGSSINTKLQSATSSSSRPGNASGVSYTNGEAALVKTEEDGNVHTAGSILHDAPPELLQALSSEFYLPMARLVSRSAQSCWNDLSMLVDRLATMPVPAPNGLHASLTTNDQSKTNLDKKDLLLNFAKEHKDVFIKLLVLLQWSRRSDEVRKTIELNLWLQQRRQAFNNATGVLGAMLRGLTDSQIPNPDLYTASEVLATGGVSTMPKLGYVPQVPLTAKQILRILGRLDVLLCTRMTLSDDLPVQLRNYHIHDGRVTFTIADEFSFDVSVASEDPQAKFGMVDFAFLFSPSPPIPDGLHEEITYIANTALDKDGFGGVYNFLHDLTLSYKLNEFAKQARKLSQGLWNGHLRVEVLRRTLVVQYWLKSSLPKSWLEIGIHSGKPLGELDMVSKLPQLKLRWLRDGKLADSSEININLSQLSIEGILRQVIAQHTNHLFDAIYDKLVLTPLYSSAELELNQSISLEDPAECVLEVQLSKTDTVHVSMEPVSGSLVLSPVSERITRLQLDLARSKGLVEEFVSRISTLRSSTADSNLFKSLSNSQWQRLDGIRVSLSEAEKLFGTAISRISCIRLPGWTQEWMVVIIQTASGDLWWLTQSVRPNSIVGSHATKLVENHPLYLIGSPSPAYLERLADYTTGVIALQCNAEYLNRNKILWRLPDIPAFDGDSRLPALQFSRTSMPPSVHSKDTTHPMSRATLRDSGSIIHLSYHGIETITKKVIMIAKFTLAADPIVLQDLVSSKLDQSVAIVPAKQQLMIRVESDIGTPIIESVVSKISHLENIVACASAVRKSTEHTLQSLSLSSITILYHKQPELSLHVNFGGTSDKLNAKFLPAETNPQRHLSEWVAKTMKRKGHNSSQNLANIFIVLRMTQPIMSYLQNIQTPVSTPGNEASKADNHLRIHVLHRQPTAYGLHYFANSANFVRDDTDPSTPKKLLARFEILAMKRGDRLMWMVRPAIEEFNAYNRSSYTSKALRERLDDEIFKKQSPLWLALDAGAACPSDKPEQLLSAIHATIVDWAKEAVKPEAASERPISTATSSSINGAPDKKPVQASQSNPTNRPNVPNQKSQNAPSRPNGISRPQQANNQQRPQNFKGGNMGIKPEVITLD